MNKKDIFTIIFCATVLAGAMVFSFRAEIKNQLERDQKSYAAWVKYTKRTDISFEEWRYLPKNSR